VSFRSHGPIALVSRILYMALLEGYGNVASTRRPEQARVGDRSRAQG
jgi:hypothetical protein